MWKKVLKSVAKGCGFTVMKNRHARDSEARLARAGEYEARLAEANMRIRALETRLRASRTGPEIESGAGGKQ